MDPGISHLDTPRADTRPWVDDSDQILEVLTWGVRHHYLQAWTT
jgi:hypothetical protein